MLVVFEGIDGSGKTTLSNRVAQALRAQGVVVEHVREGGKFASPVTQAIREFGRDQRNLDLSAHAELFLFLTRDVQLMDDAILPALGRADVVIADRFFYTAEAIARWGRGLPPCDVGPALEAARRGLRPDLVVLVDVDPHIARARRRVSKILAPERRPVSRKGLGGAGMLHRLRDGYREMAAREPDLWLTVDNTHASLDAVVAHLVDALEEARRHGGSAAIARAAARRLPSPPARAVPTGPDDALDAFLELIDRRAKGEPDLAAYLLAGLAGDAIDSRRLALADRAPAVLAWGLQRMADPVSWRLRRMLVDRAPRQVARSLAGPNCNTHEGRGLRAALAGCEPAEVAGSLDGLDDDEAWTLREQLYPRAPDETAASLCGLDGPRGWALRERWLCERGEHAVAERYELAAVICASVSGVEDERAWALRERSAAVAPVPAIASLRGLVSERAWRWRERYMPRAAKTVMGTLRGLDDPRAWSCRAAVAQRCKEAFDSMVGLDGDVAWRLREAFLDTWPSTVLKSLGALRATARGQAMVVRQLVRYPGNVSILQQAATLAAQSNPKQQLAA